MYVYKTTALNNKCSTNTMGCTPFS